MRRYSASSQITQSSVVRLEKELLNYGILVPSISETPGPSIPSERSPSDFDGTRIGTTQSTLIADTRNYAESLEDYAISLAALQSLATPPTPTPATWWCDINNAIVSATISLVEYVDTSIPQHSFHLAWAKVGSGVFELPGPPSVVIVALLREYFRSGLEKSTSSPGEHLAVRLTAN